MVEEISDKQAEPQAVRAKVLQGIPHAFMHKGSKGPDEAAALAAVGQGEPLLMVRQVHSADVVFVADPASHSRDIAADALVTRCRGVAIGVVTADCAPVLMADEEAGVIAAVHAGWRGAQGGIIGQTVSAMVRAGAQANRIEAAIGPCIAQESYEVGDDMKSHFEHRDAAFFLPGREGHWQFDLPAYVASRLTGAGVERVEALAIDTYQHPDRFHSFRLTTHRGEETGGRQISLIALPTS